MAEHEEQKKQTILEQFWLLPRWKRLLLLFAFMLFFAVIGAMIGYGAVGEGNALDVLKPSTWTHIWNIVYKQN